MLDGAPDLSALFLKFIRAFAPICWGSLIIVFIYTSAFVWLYKIKMFRDVLYSDLSRSHVVLIFVPYVLVNCFNTFAVVI